MPILETPPNPASPPPSVDNSPLKVRTGRFGELEEHELIHLLDTLDDERERARFRESVYISLLLWAAFALFLIFAPKYLFHQVQIVQPNLGKPHEMTSLSVPKIPHALPRVPKIAPRAPRMQEPAPAAPAPQPAAPVPAQVKPQQQVAAAPAPPPPPRPAPPTLATLPAAPAPSPVQARPNFSTPSTAGDMIRQATQGPRTGGFGQGVAPMRNARGAQVGTGAPEILSDTMGVDFDPYLQKIMRMIRDTWLPLIPEEARPPLNKQGETQIRFIILPDGRLKIGGMILEDSTHDDAINRSCWGSITGVGQFPPLPSEFHGPQLELRVHYFVNEQPQ